MSVLLCVTRHKQHMDRWVRLMLNKNFNSQYFFQVRMIYNKWEFTQSIKIYVGVLKVSMQFLGFSALPESRSLVSSESAQYHRSHIFQETVNTYQYILFIFDNIISRFNSGRRNVWSLNVGECYIPHCKLFRLF